MKNESKEKTSKSKSHFGKYGILSLSSIFIKKAEFQAWLEEEKNLNNQDLSSKSEKNYMEEFIHKYNNCKFTKKKFYNYHKWAAKENLKLFTRKKRTRKANDPNYLINNNENTEFVFDDEGKKEKEKKLLRELEQKKKLEEAIYTMNKEKADAMRELDFKSNLMRHYYQTGNMVAAKDTHKKLFGTKTNNNAAENGEGPIGEFSGDEDGKEH